MCSKRQTLSEKKNTLGTFNLEEWYCAPQYRDSETLVVLLSLIHNSPDKTMTLGTL